MGAAADQRKRNWLEIVYQSYLCRAAQVFRCECLGTQRGSRLAAHGHPALALPLFSCTALDLDLAYAPSHLVRGRRHKDATTADQIRGDVFAALNCLRTRYSWPPFMWWCSASGGHVAFRAARCYPGLCFHGVGVC